ncbi:hypothetical protein EDC94DRAFT_693741 [Helicostylum pulchrum]|nr:hypothetical protein EDC94DRAFT_693741 [Helicostylum pulchrum]
MGCLDYMYNCFKSLKNSFKDYQVHASGYDTQQYYTKGAFGNTDAFACGVFALTNLICSEKRYIENYFCPNKTSSFDEYYIDVYDVNNNEYNEDDEYCFIDEYEMNYDGYDGDILSACIAEYATDNEEYIAGALSADEDETQYPPTRNFENSWGFIDHNDLSVEFKDTTLPPKCPQKAVGICLLILAQAKNLFQSVTLIDIK